MPFHLSPESRISDPAVLAALRALRLPVRSPAKALNHIGERLEEISRPQDRGRIPSELLQRFLCAVALRMAALEKSWAKITDAEILAEIGVRKIIIAAGKSVRFSPSGLARKQLARADDFSTLLLQARQAVGLHCCSDVIVVDPVTAYQVLSMHILDPEDPTVRLSRARDYLNLPREVSALLKGKDSLTVLDLSELYCQARSFFRQRHPKDAARAAALLDDFAHALFRPFVEDDRSSRIMDYGLRITHLGSDILLALARPWGPGEAFLEGLRRLKDLGIAGQTRYVMPVYSDYAPALLPHYPPIYLQVWMEAVASPDAVITLGAKSPLDKVADRGNIVLADGPAVPAGPVPQAIREWRDMMDAEREDAQRRLERSKQTGQPHHGLNAGVFVIDRAWAERQATRLRRDFDHPDPAKGKLHEYWYTDLVEIAAKQRRSRKVVFLGEESPAGCKDVRRLVEFGEQLISATRQVLLDLGIHADATSRVRIRSLDSVFSIESAAKKIFGERPDSVHLFGDIFLEDSVRIAAGVVLDGRGRPVVLEGDTYVGAGVGIRGSTVYESHFIDNNLDEFRYQANEGDDLHTPTEVISSELVASDIGPSSSIHDSFIVASFVQGDVFESGLAHGLVCADESVELRKSKEETKSLLLKPDEESLTLGLIPGAFQIRELPPKDRQGVLNFIREEMEKLFQEKIGEPKDCQRALAATERLWKRDAFLSPSDFQTPESLYRHAFGWLRKALEGSDVSDPFHAEKQAELKALRPQAEAVFGKVAKHNFAENPKSKGTVGPWDRGTVEPEFDSRHLFRDITILATQANLFDWQSPTVRKISDFRFPISDFQTQNRKFPRLTIGNWQSAIGNSLALDGYPAYESLIFSGGPADFLYLTDNTGETLFDALVWYALCQLGHRVIVAAKDKPAGGDATVDDVLAIVQERPEFRKLFERRSLRVISNGTDTYGTFLDRVPEEFRVVYHSPSLRAIIGKGQANLYTTVARNRLKVPYVAQFLVKGMTAERLTGVRALRRGGKKIPRPVIAVIPPGHCITEHAPGTPGATTLKQKMVSGEW